MIAVQSMWRWIRIMGWDRYSWAHPPPLEALSKLGSTYLHVSNLPQVGHDQLQPNLDQKTVSHVCGNKGNSLSTTLGEEKLHYFIELDHML